jgi:hypothetical protein
MSDHCGNTSTRYVYDYGHDKEEEVIRFCEVLLSFYLTPRLPTLPNMRAYSGSARTRRRFVKNASAHCTKTKNRLANPMRK